MNVGALHKRQNILFEVRHILYFCMAHFCLFKVKLFSIWPHGYSKDVRAPSQIYKWVSHNEYDDTKQKYSCVSSGNSYNLIYSILLWQMHCRNVLCSKGLLNHLWKNSDTGVGKSDFEHSKYFQILFCLICCIFHSHCRVCYIIISLVTEGCEILKCYFFVLNDRLTIVQVCLTTVCCSNEHWNRFSLP